MKALLARFRGCSGSGEKGRGADFREDSEVMEKEDAVMSLGYVGESGLGDGRSWEG